jgi:hypothetical protein
MKKAAIFLPVLVIFLALTSPATEPPDRDESGCPAHRAAQQGFKLLQDMHKIMAPAWHEGYPAMDYAALGESVVKFNDHIPELKKLTPKFKTIERQVRFNESRSYFIELVIKGKAAWEAGDNDTLYALYPNLHISFEEMAFHLLPLQFHEYSSFRTVVDLMIDTHLANKDYKAIVSSLEALKIKNNQLQKAHLPAELKSVEEQVAADIAAIGDMCHELEQACGSTTTKKIDECLEKLKKLCQKFEQNYI